MAGRRGDWKHVRSLFRASIDPPADLIPWSFLDEMEPPYHSNSDKIRAFRCLGGSKLATQASCPSFSAAKIKISEFVFASSVLRATRQLTVFLPKTRWCPPPREIDPSAQSEKASPLVRSVEKSGPRPWMGVPCGPWKRQRRRLSPLAIGYRLSRPASVRAAVSQNPRITVHPMT